MTTAYYNENEPYAAQWLRNLVAAGLIAPGDVDERSILDVRPSDLDGYAQCHFFAGLGGWSVALHLAGWDDARPVWTGSCPCQPFSSAGRRKGGADERHLWPRWFGLIRECHPAIVFGEQVARAVGQGWLDQVAADLEGQSYAFAAAVLPACAVDAPHLRNRLWFVADAGSAELRDEPGRRSGPDGSGAPVARSHGATRSVANPHLDARQQRRPGDAQEVARGLDADRSCIGAGDVADAQGERQQPRSGASQEVGAGAAPAVEPEGCAALPAGRGSPTVADASGTGLEVAFSGHARQQPPALGSGDDAFAGRDGYRQLPAAGRAPARWPSESGIRRVAHGIPARAPKLRALGNAIVPALAAQFIEAYMSLHVLAP